MYCYCNGLSQFDVEWARHQARDWKTGSSSPTFGIKLPWATHSLSPRENNGNTTDILPVLASSAGTYQESTMTQKHMLPNPHTHTRRGPACDASTYDCSDLQL